MKVIYLDTCCLNRPFDDQTQEHIHLEAEAVLLILARCEAHQWEWLGSAILDYEIAQTPDPERRARVSWLARHAHRTVAVDETITSRAMELERLGLGAFDALHIASAEAGQADVFLTTDQALLRRAARLGETLSIPVANPLTWLRELWDTWQHEP
jgi:predicted nucleic acid-binding protein